MTDINVEPRIEHGKLTRGRAVEEAHRIGRDVAAVWAAEVDRDARFPSETVAELRSCGFLGASVPEQWGGPGVELAELSQAVAALAEYCASSAMILAMHWIQVSDVFRHGGPEMLNEVLPAVARGEILFASAASEVGLNGNRGSSVCALEPTPAGNHVEKQGTTVSYGEFADGILVTARRSPDSPDNDVALAVCLPGSFTVTPSGPWDTLGLRGTCSRPALVVADVADHLVIPDWSSVLARTSLPVSVVLLSAVWLGLAEAAAKKAHEYLRAQARREGSSGKQRPLGTLRLVELTVPLQQLRDCLAMGAIDFERADADGELETMKFSARMNAVKLSATALAIDVVQRASQLCGMAGYANTSPFTLGRIIRDVTAAPLMISNDRVLDDASRLMIIRKEL